MKVAAILLALLSTTAHAQVNRTVLPPAEFDHPYEGELTVMNVDQDWVRLACPSIKMAFALGCAHPRPMHGKCTILLAPLAVIEAAGFTLDVVMRHEIGHCNGWPSDHRGARPIFQDKELQPPG